MKALYAVLIILPALGVGVVLGSMKYWGGHKVPSPEAVAFDLVEQISELRAELETKEDRLTRLMNEGQELQAELVARDRQIVELQAAIRNAAPATATPIPTKPISGAPSVAPIDRIGPRPMNPATVANAELAAAPSPVEVPELPVSTTPAPLFAEAYGGALSRLDWKLIGTSLNELTKLTPGIIQFLDRGRAPPVDLTTSVADMKRGLQLQVLLLEQDVPGTGLSGKFTDPACVANAILATLKAAELPLSAEQTGQIEAIAARFMMDDARRRSGYGDQSYALEMLLDEVELKARCYDAFFGALSAQQAKHLRPALTAGRLLVDPFSQAAVFGDGVHVQTFKNADGLVADMHDGIRRLFGNDGALLAQSGETVERWAEEHPKAEFLPELNTLDRAGMITADRATTWGHLVLDLQKSLVDDLHLSGERATTIRKLSMLSVPVR